MLNTNISLAIFIYFKVIFMTIDASMFDFDAMKAELGADPFEEKNTKTYAVDERFYRLGRDKDGNGAAIIRFLPDSERGMIQEMFKINTNVIHNGKKRFVSEYSPHTIGQPCPFQEKWQELWNSGDKEGSKVYSRSTSYVTNIKVLRDPANPENEGKIFLYEMSMRMRDKIRAAVDPSQQDRDLGATPKEMFNPLRGNSFKLACKKGANGQITYDASEVIPEVTSIYESPQAAIQDIKENTHKLSDLLNPEAFMTYQELQEKLRWVTFTDQVAQPAKVDTLKAEVNTAQPKQTEVQESVAQVAQVAQSKSDSLDDLLNGLI